MGMDYNNVIMFGVSLDELGISVEEFMEDFGFEDEEDAELFYSEDEFGYLDTGGCRRGKLVAGVLINCTDVRYDSDIILLSMSEMLDYESQFYDKLEEHGVLKKYGKGDFLIFNYVY